MTMSSQLIGCWAAAAALACGSPGGGGKSGGGNETATPIVTPAGNPVGPMTNATIGTAGGELQSDDGLLTITVPAGALSADTAFSAQRYSSGLPGSIGPSYMLEPHGVDFPVPLTLTFSVPEAGVSRAGVGAIGVAYREEDGRWSLVPATRDEDARTLQVTTGHLSSWSRVEGLQLLPNSATVQLGGTQNLTIGYCSSDEFGWDGGYLVSPCKSLPSDGYDIYDWSVNGTVTGDATYGRIWPSGTDLNVGIYTAPTKKPDPSTVRASVDLRKSLGSSMILVSMLHIGEPAVYEGDISFSSSGLFSFTGGGTAHLTPRTLPDGTWEDDDQQTKYDVSFDLGIDDGVTFSGYPCTVAQQTSSGTAKYGLTYYKVPARVDFTVSPTWDVVCHMGGGVDLPTKIGLSWATCCETRLGIDDGTWGYPLNDPNQLKGSYTHEAAPACLCAASPATQTVSWEFQQIASYE